MTVQRHERFDDALDDAFPPVVVLGMTYPVSTVLFECDPIAYDVNLSDWLDAECKDGSHEWADEENLCVHCGQEKEGDDDDDM